MPVTKKSLKDEAPAKEAPAEEEAEEEKAAPEEDLDALPDTPSGLGLKAAGGRDGDPEVYQEAKRKARWG